MYDFTLTDACHFYCVIGHRLFMRMHVVPWLSCAKDQRLGLLGTHHATSHFPLPSQRVYGPYIHLATPLVFLPVPSCSSASLCSLRIYNPYVLLTTPILAWNNVVGSLFRHVCIGKQVFCFMTLFTNKNCCYSRRASSYTTLFVFESRLSCGSKTFRFCFVVTWESAT